MDQTQISQIREEQNAQFSAPKKPYQTAVQTFSNLFHPLLMLTFAALVVSYFTPMAIILQHISGSSLAKYSSIPV